MEIKTTVPRFIHRCVIGSFAGDQTDVERKLPPGNWRLNSATAFISCDATVATREMVITAKRGSNPPVVIGSAGPVTAGLETRFSIADGLTRGALGTNVHFATGSAASLIIEGESVVKVEIADGQAADAVSECELEFERDA